MPLFGILCEEAVCINYRADGERGVNRAFTGTTGWGGMGACSAVGGCLFICRTGGAIAFRATARNAGEPPRGGAKTLSFKALGRDYRLVIKTGGSSQRR